jgi:hypothetical protein
VIHALPLVRPPSVFANDHDALEAIFNVHVLPRFPEPRSLDTTYGRGVGPTVARVAKERLPAPRGAVQPGKGPSMPTNSSVYNGLRETLISPNECDRNWEPANVVDGLYAVMRAIRWHDQTIALGLLLEHGSVEQREQALAQLITRVDGPGRVSGQ